LTNKRSFATVEEVMMVTGAPTRDRVPSAAGALVKVLVANRGEIAVSPLDERTNVCQY
jgi:hypothetical protein